jgi:UDP-glucose 4-epimerase
MARVLVTGAFGYIGLAVVRALASHDVIAFGHKARNALAAQTISTAVEVVEGDLLELPERLASLGAIDAVIHLAGGGGTTKIAADPTAGIRANIRGTTGLAAAARAHGVSKLLFASTIAVYGTHRDQGRPYREADIPLPDEPYGAVKEAAEHAWVDLAGGTALRIANVYGAGAGVDLGLQGAVERFARAAAAGGELSIFGTGEQRIDYVHVDDVAHAFRLALESQTALPGRLNVGGGDPIAIGRLAELCVTAGTRLGKSARLVRQPAPPGKAWPDRSLDIRLADAVLGWKPKVTYEEGLDDLVRMMEKGSKA